MKNESKKQAKNTNNSNEKLLLSDVSVAVAVENILQPKYMNDVYTWKQVRDAILKATERITVSGM